MLGLPAGIPALIVLVGAVVLGRMAADDYAEGPIQRVSVVAMVVSTPFAVWGLFNSVFFHLDLGMVSMAIPEKDMKSFLEFCDEKSRCGRELVVHVGHLAHCAPVRNMMFPHYPYVDCEPGPGTRLH